MTGKGAAPRILVVEDEESLADTVRYNLEREGFAVVVETDGRTALERFRVEDPSLVILDLMLPEMSGLDVCRQIRQISDVPIIMVTAKDSEADKVSGLELGADDYVTKPFSVRELVSRVRAHLRRAGMHPAEPRRTYSPGALSRSISEGMRFSSVVKRSDSLRRSSSCSRRSCDDRAASSPVSFSSRRYGAQVISVTRRRSTFTSNGSGRR